MSETQTPRFNLSQWSSDSDPAVTRADLDDDNQQVETLAAIAIRSAAASRPGPGVRERLHYATDTGAVSWDDGAAWHIINPTPVLSQAIAFHIAFGLTTGLKTPKFIAPANMTLRSANAVLGAGSGVTYRLFINGAAVSDIPTSAAVGTSVTLNDFTDHDISTGDTVQVYIANAGSSASDLSVTALATFR